MFIERVTDKSVSSLQRSETYSISRPTRKRCAPLERELSGNFDRRYGSKARVKTPHVATFGAIIIIADHGEKDRARFRTGRQDNL